MFYLLAESSFSSSIPLQVGVGGIFAILVLKEVFNFITKQKEKNGGGLGKMQGEMATLYKWHEPDAEGEQTWKNKQMIVLLTEIKQENVRSTKALENSNRVMERLLPILSRLETSIKS